MRVLTHRHEPHAAIGWQVVLQTGEHRLKEPDELCGDGLVAADDERDGLARRWTSEGGFGRPCECIVG
jgi:hypothetical protein